MAETADLSGLPLDQVEHRVTIGDTDATGNIYFAAPFPWAESTLVRWLAALGHPISAVMDDGHALPLLRASAEYLAPVGVDDVITISLHCPRMGRSSFDLEFEMAAHDVTAVRVTCAYVWARLDRHSDTDKLRAEPLPTWLREALSGSWRAGDAAEDEGTHRD